MKEISLLLLRISTGLYLVIWGVYKLLNTDRAVLIFDKYYGGIISADTLIMGIGALQIALGVLVVIGLARSFSYVAQAAWYLAGIVPIMANIIDPFGLYLAKNAAITFFPSTTLLFASLVLIAFKDFDTLSIDHKRTG